MNKELTKEEAEEYYNKLWLENKDLIQENIGKLNTKRFALEMELIDKDEEIERLNNLLKETSQTLSEQTTKAITLKSENERLNKELKSLQDSYDIEEEQANYHINLTDDLREEVDRLNNIINKGIEAINVYQDEKTLSVSYVDLKRIRGILQGDDFDLMMFEEFLKELKGEDKE